MNVLVVVGGGYVGAILRPALEREHRCRHFDLNPIPGSDPSSIVGDVTSFELARQAVQGLDAVLYLAMGSLKDEAKSVRTSLDVNVRGVYVLLDAAGRAGIRRFVYASTLSVYEKINPALDESHPTDSWWAYGLSKRLGEHVCETAARHFPGLCALALRLMLPRNEQDWPPMVYDPKKADNHCALGPNDTRRLFLAALNCDKPGAHIVQATGDLEQKKFPHDRVHALLGWLPEGN